MTTEQQLILAPNQNATSNVRFSNIELFRIIVMLCIIAHHYVVNSPLFDASGPLFSNPTTSNSIFYLLFGMWGKTGINCFVMITGFFMCTSSISIKKFLKLYFEVKFFRYIIWVIFILTGASVFSVTKSIKMLFPFSNISNSFTNAFLAFYLFIPFLNTLIKGLDKSKHSILIILSTLIYSGFYQLPGFHISYNYLSWFIILYFISSYIRLYGIYKNNSVSFWGLMSLLSIIASIGSVLICIKTNHSPYLFVGESLAFMSVLTAISTFIFFKNLKIGYSKIINLIGSTTFGVFLIHTCGQEMRSFLWIRLLDVNGHYSDSHYVLYAFTCVLLIFTICSILDLIRMYLFEKPLFKVLDKKLGKYKLYSGPTKNTARNNFSKIFKD